jgi:heat shock protein HtpX
MQSMNREQVRAVLAHEVAHVANGDMQTMGLLQGVMNTFVMFAARVVGHAVDKAVLRNEGDRPGLGYMATVVVLDLVFGLLASLVVMAFSRHREFRADHGAAELLGSAVPMQSALRALSGAESDLPKQVSAFGIAGGGASLLNLLRSHPPIEQRISALDRFGR